jgi:hypothetical protein
VTSKPKQLEAYWDRDAVPIQTAVSGVMRISDGDASEVVPFDTDQLKDGHLTYQPVTNDVSLRLEVINREGQTVSESVRAVAMP